MEVFFLLVFFFILFFAGSLDTYKNNIYAKNDELREHINRVIKENIQIVNLTKEL